MNAPFPITLAGVEPSSAPPLSRISLLKIFAKKFPNISRTLGIFTNLARTKFNTDDPLLPLTTALSFVLQKIFGNSAIHRRYFSRVDFLSVLFFFFEFFQPGIISDETERMKIFFSPGRSLPLSLPIRNVFTMCTLRLSLSTFHCGNPT